MTINYGGDTLPLSDALYGHQLDSTIHYARWSPMRVFDPSDVSRLMVQDAIANAGDGLPALYDGWYCDVALGVVQPRWAGVDGDFARYVESLRYALLLPLCEPFLSALRDLFDAWAVPEGERRIAARERRLHAALRYGNGPGWETADLLAEVEAVCGPGKKQGRQWAFTCPFHIDRHPSLMVDPAKKVWTCWPCQKGGGVVAFRRAIGK